MFKPGKNWTPILQNICSHREKTVDSDFSKYMFTPGKNGGQRFFQIYVYTWKKRRPPIFPNICLHREKTVATDFSQM
jgi:hypothetical protein